MSGNDVKPAQFRHANGSPPLYDEKSMSGNDVKPVQFCHVFDIPVAEPISIDGNDVKPEHPRHADGNVSTLLVSSMEKLVIFDRFRNDIVMSVSNSAPVIAQEVIVFVIHRKNVSDELVTVILPPGTSDGVASAKYEIGPSPSDQFTVNAPSQVT